MNSRYARLFFGYYGDGLGATALVLARSFIANRLEIVGKSSRFKFLSLGIAIDAKRF